MLLFEEPVVSAATKHPQAAREAPSAVTIITREEIRRFGYRTLAEALRSVRGFYGSYDRNYSYIGVRGFLRPGDYNDRILLLVNGHTYNDDIYQTAYLGQEFGIDLEAVDRIEVVRGPGSSLYGGNALFAVINVVTMNGADLPGTHALVETGSFWRKRSQVSVGHVFDNGLDAFASGSVLDVDGPENLSFPAYANVHDGIARNADAERALDFFASGTWHGFFLQGGVNSRDKTIPTGAFGTTFGDPGTRTVDGRRFADLTYTTEIRPDITVAARAFYDGVRYHGTYIYGAGARRTKNEDLAPSDWYGTELRTRIATTARNTVTVGGEYTYHPSARQLNYNLPSHVGFLDDTRSFATYGVYVQDEFVPLPSVTLVGGARYDSYYGRIDEVSPRAAGIWTPRDDTTVKLLYGKAFRAPNLYEQYYGTAAGTAYISNPHLDSERIATYEGVVEKQLARGAQGIVALYRYDIDGLIDQTAVHDPGGTRIQYRNLDTVHANGVETELRVPLPHGMRLRTSYSLQEARTDGRLLSNSPKHLGDVALLATLPFEVLAGAEVQIVGPRRTLTGHHVETAGILNLDLERHTPIRDLDFAVGLYNLLDQTYADPAGAELRQDRVEQDGFTFRAQLRYAF